MFDIVLLALRFGFLFLLYLFLFLIVRMVYKDMSRVDAPREPARNAKPERQQPRLVVLEGPGGDAGKVYPLGGTTLIGRSHEADVFLEDNFVSTNHARITNRGGRFRLEDAGSTNGTYLGGSRITNTAELERGNKIKIGRTVLEYLD
ncbi:MAG: FHA domain-containing protein [Terriglobia bacterium]